jgi:hypothetical protein
VACIDCGAGLHFNCGTPCCCNGENSTPVAEEDEKGYEGRTYKRDSTLKDQQSTGRKRAARMYPINPEAPCEWRGLRNAGGGQIAIVGCNDGIQQARHHGPDKNTLNNEEGNVHRICVRCHNRWHTKNDPIYTASNIGANHDDKTKATVTEIMESELYWARNKTVKAKD